jgi:hypothetical protein
MVPGFSAEHSLYQSCTQYVSFGGGTSGFGGIVPAATNVCATSGGKTQCGTVTGVGEGILWGMIIGGVGGPVGGLIGGVLGGIFCWIFGCD